VHVKIARWSIFWIGVIGGLVILELGEITRAFTVPLATAILSPYSILIGILLVTIFALVGAVFVGFYLSSRIYSTRSFTPFEEEMLHMRTEVAELREELKQLLADREPPTPPATPGPGEGPR
jgi:formate/nitrite transporter FocA (FNT family)